MKMAVRKLTCIECPKGCRMAVDVGDSRVIKVSANQCPEGEKYAISEIENPGRILTSTVMATGLGLKFVPVRTDKPIPKARIFEAMTEIKKIRVARPLNSGEVIVKNFLGLDADLIATRKAE
jgi:CxxC motif-containing protein